MNAAACDLVQAQGIAEAIKRRTRPAPMRRSLRMFCVGRAMRREAAASPSVLSSARQRRGYNHG